MVTNHPTNECSLPDCFCHEAQRLEAKSSSVEQGTQKPTINPYEYLKGFKYPPEHRWKCACGWSGSPSEMTVSNELRTCPECGGSGGLILDTSEQPTPDSPALHRGRSILHHVEMVEERRRTQLTFEQEWQSAPKSIKHGCEETSAQFFYHAGRRDRETEMLREVNEVLSRVVERIEQERVK